MSRENDSLIEAIIQGIQEKKGHRVAVADLSKMSGAVAPYFVICEGNTPTQVSAIADFVWEHVRRTTGEKPIAMDGERLAEWIAMDYGTVIVHVFIPERRVFYDLEHLWEDAPLRRIADID